MSENLTVLILLSQYLPGYKAGGPLRTISSIVHYLGDEFRFHIITQDRDLGDLVPYPDVEVNAWQMVGKANVCYVSPDQWTLFGLRRVIRQRSYDLVYLNSLFAGITINYLALRRLRLLPAKPIILAPRGETDPGAMSLKTSKKQAYLRVTRAINFYEDILWQASSAAEANAIANLFPAAAIHTALDLAAPLVVQSSTAAPEKRVGSVRLVYLSRITPKKNLLYALECLEKVYGDIVFDIYGPIEDDAYWQQCQRLAARLPQNIQVRYEGLVEHEKVGMVLSQYHALFLPTLGENFGHVIVEALSAGCLVLTSDQTPWRNLENAGVGWDVPLEPALSVKALSQLIALDGQTFEERRQAALQYGQNVLASEQVLAANREMFIRACRPGFTG